MVVSKPINLSIEEKQILRTERAIREMVATDGWKIFVAILSRKLHEKRNEYEAPAEVFAGQQGGAIALDGWAQVLRSESAKGSILGIRLAIELPQGMLQDAENLRIQKGLNSSEDDQ